MEVNDKQIVGILEPIKKRFSDPIVGTYIVSFAIYNWKIWIYLFSSLDVNAKVLSITQMLQLSNLDDYFTFAAIKILLINQYTCPLLFTIFYLFVLPKKFLFAYNYLIDLKINNSNERFKRERQLLPVSEHIALLNEKLQNEIYNSDKKSELVGTLKAEIDSLKSTIENETVLRYEKDQEIKNLNEQVRQHVKRLDLKNEDDNLHTIKETIFHRGWENDFMNISDEILTGNVIVGSSYLSNYESLLAYLAAHNLIKREESAMIGDNEFWRLTDNGKKLKSIF